MSTYRFSGILSLTGNLPCLTLPVFSDELGIRYMQEINDEDLVSKMKILTGKYLEFYSELPGNDLLIEIGSKSIYCFLTSKDKFVVGIKSKVASYIEKNFSSLELLPAEKLLVLDFIDAPLAEKITAIEAISDLFDNELISSLFRRLERGQRTRREAGDDSAYIDLKLSHLAQSGTFVNTHNIVGQLQPLVGIFSARQARAAFDAALSNSQVGWIATDHDVHQFLSKIYETGNVYLTPDEANHLSINISNPTS